MHRHCRFASANLIEIPWPEKKKRVLDCPIPAKMGSRCGEVEWFQAWGLPTPSPGSAKKWGELLSDEPRPALRERTGPWTENQALGAAAFLGDAGTLCI